MKRTGNLVRLLCVFLLVFGVAQTAVAQSDINVKASLTETNIFEGESVKLEISISGNSLTSVERPIIPEIPGLRYLPNRTFTGSSYSYINGRPSVTQNFAFQFIAKEPGSYTIPELEVGANGKKYKTNTVSFKILDSKTSGNANAASSPDIYVRLEPSSQNPVIGEQVVVDVVLYFKDEVDVSNYNTVPGWKAEGFWKEELNNPSQARSTSTIIDGVRYKRARLLQYALFPTKAGELTLSPYKITVRVRNNRRTARDPFSFNFGQENKELETLPITITVNRPTNTDEGEYIGAVGKFKITRRVTPKTAFIGESVEVITEISGEGNVPLLNKPTYEYPTGLELYNPQEKTDITRDNRKIAGKRIFTDVIIARAEGVYSLPEKKVAIYNPDKKSYDYTTLPKISFEATIDPDVKVVALEDMRLDIEPIIGLANWKESNAPTHSSRGIVWAMIFMPFLLLIGAFGYKNYYDKMNNDSSFARSNKAKEVAFNTLKEARQMEDIREGYHKIQKALSQFIADKRNLPIAGISYKKLMEEVEQTSLSQQSIIELKRIFDKCETIAYAPNISQEGLDDDIQKSETLIKEMGKAL